MKPTDWLTVFIEWVGEPDYSIHNPDAKYQITQSICFHHSATSIKDGFSCHNIGQESPCYIVEPSHLFEEFWFKVKDWTLGLTYLKKFQKKSKSKKTKNKNKVGITKEKVKVKFKSLGLT